MANQLTMVRIHDILTLVHSGLSQRQVADKLQVHRQTVARYLRLARQGSVSAGISPFLGAEGVPKPTGAPPGNFGQKSQCEPLRAIIEGMVQQRLTARRIWQDLKLEHGFTGSYYSVRRFVRQLEAVRELPFRRMECDPGEEVQVDFGLGALVKRAGGKMKRPHVFRIVLSHSRKAYSEAVWRQDTETFLRCLENAFRSFGGVPRTVVVDNLKAAVIHPDWYDPQLNPKVASFGEHYGTVILPTRSYTPRHKGKVERQVGYVQDNGLKARTFDDLAAQNTYLAWWEENVADQRIHGTTRQQVRSLFDQERPMLSPLPAGYFPFFREGERSVHRDGHVEVDNAYYSVPPEYTGLRVWVRYDSRLIHIYNRRMEQIAVHCRLETGRFSTDPSHIHKEKVSGVERGAEYHLRRTERIGPWSHLWAKTMLEERGIPGIRVLVGFVSLTRRYSDRQLEKACQIALRQGCYHLRPLRHLVKEPAEQPNLAFMDHHPLIRPMKDYQDIVMIDFNPEERARIFPFPTSDPDDADQDGREKSAESTTRDVPRDEYSHFSIGDENYEGHSQIDAQTASAFGPCLEPGSSSAGGRGQPSEPSGIPGTAHSG